MDGRFLSLGVLYLEAILLTVQDRAMASQVTGDESATSSQDKERSEPSLVVEVDEQDRRYIEVCCGKEKGRLYLGKLGKAKGCKSMEKCIEVKGKLLSPQDFEALAGKKARAWKKSIRHQNKPLSKFFSTGELAELELVPVGDQDQAEHRGDQPQLVDGRDERAPSLSAIPDPPSSNMTGTSPDLFARLETQLLDALRETIKAAVDSLRESLETRIVQLADEVEALRMKVAMLEGQATARADDQPRHEQQEVIASLNTRVEAVAATVSIQQKVLETNERSNRAKNVIIVGLQEDQQEENIEEKVQELLRDKLDLEDIAVASAKRLGRPKERHQKSPRSVLVELENRNDKQKILQRRIQLAGTRIYINNDLTREQQEAEKKLRDMRNKLRKLPEFSNQKITIYRGKLHVDRRPIPEETLHKHFAST